MTPSARPAPSQVPVDPVLLRTAQRSVDGLLEGFTNRLSSGVAVNAEAMLVEHPEHAALPVRTPASQNCKNPVTFSHSSENQG